MTHLLLHFLRPLYSFKRSELVLNDILANPRFEFFKVLDQMGAKIECISIKNQGGEQVKDIKIRFGHLEAIKIMIKFPH